MDEVIKFLAPIFILSLFIQTFQEYIDEILNKFTAGWSTTRQWSIDRVPKRSGTQEQAQNPSDSSTSSKQKEGDEKKKRKKAVTYVVSIVLAWIITSQLKLCLLSGMVEMLGTSAKAMFEIEPSEIPGWVDRIVSVFIIAGGTETTNSIVKFLGYKKEETKKKNGQEPNGESPNQPGP
jgi:energy-coupling factor transporter transmembrane protein EcfT